MPWSGLVRCTGCGVYPLPSGSVGLLFPGGCLCVWLFISTFPLLCWLAFLFFLLFQLVFHWFAYGAAGLFHGFVYGVALVFTAWSMGLFVFFCCTSVHFSAGLRPAPSFYSLQPLGRCLDLRRVCLGNQELYSQSRSV